MQKSGVNIRFQFVNTSNSTDPHSGIRQRTDVVLLDLNSADSNPEFILKDRIGALRWVLMQLLVEFKLYQSRDPHRGRVFATDFLEHVSNEKAIETTGQIERYSAAQFTRQFRLFAHVMGVYGPVA
ncbi:hypothetical protein K474DRAFT_1448810 [Panus rudis PR-1116 ss-1]|nr:hypothetical protein K474DRAFT_1448810 [Panus rudis PR-1116 ss-1]